MTENDFRRLIADNLIYYRKRAGMTQAEVAAHINYSDKSVSKWERGDGCPDVYVMTLLAELYNVNINMLTSPRSEQDETEALVPDEIQTEPEVPRRSATSSPFLTLLSVGGVWLVATIIFSILNMTHFASSRTYLAFIYAITASFVVIEVFAACCRRPAILHLLFSSGILWTLMVSIHLTAINVENIYLIYVIAAVAQLLGIFALGLYWQMIRLPSKPRKQKKLPKAENPS